MTTNKELLQKLYKIAENQQKIIRKLAQVAPAQPAQPATAAPQDNDPFVSEIELKINRVVKVALEKLKIDATPMTAVACTGPNSLDINIPVTPALTVKPGPTINKAIIDAVALIVPAEYHNFTNNSITFAGNKIK